MFNLDKALVLSFQTFRNLIPKGTCYLGELIPILLWKLFLKRSWTPSPQENYYLGEHGWCYHFVSFSLRKIPWPSGKFLCSLGEVALWGNVIPFSSKIIAPLTNLIPLVADFLLEKLFLFSLEKSFLWGTYLKLTFCLLLFKESPFLGASSLKEVTYMLFFFINFIHGKEKNLRKGSNFIPFGWKGKF